MTTSKGTIQGYNGVATVDKKHQIIIDAQAFGEGQEHHRLKPVLEAVRDRFNRLGIANNIYKKDVIVTADTGFANENNMKYVHENKINAYIPDNQFRSRDPKFADQKKKYGKRHQENKSKTPLQIPATEFTFNPKAKTCICPAGNQISYSSEIIDQRGHRRIYFEGKLTDCRHCELKHQCMRQPPKETDTTSRGRRVSFILKRSEGKNTYQSKYTDWMKKRVDSPFGKQVYGHRMSVVEPVFGNIGTNKSLNRFSLRGKEKVQSQWRLFSMIHNIEKLMKYGT